jgi:selenocysteine-specific elongation factor
MGVSTSHAAEVLKLLVSEGKICRVTDELYFTREAIERLKERLVAHLKAHKEISTQTFKEMVGQSRKFVIPLSEFFDRERVTLRVGEKRVLRRG